MAHLPYPALAEATQCLIDGIAIARQGFDAVVAQKAAMGEHVWSVQGFIHSIVLGTTHGPFLAMSADDETGLGNELEEFATEFQACCGDRMPADALAKVKNDGFAASQSGERKINFKKWLQFFVTYVLPILISLLEKPDVA